MVNFINQQRSLNDPCQFPDAEFYVDGIVSGAKLTSFYKTSSYIRARAVGYSYVTLATWNSTLQAYVPNNRGLRIVVTGGADVNNEDFLAWYLSNTSPSGIDFIYKVADVAMTETANAIRSKSSSTSQLAWDTFNGFRDAVNDIYLGNDTRNATAFPSDIVIGQTAFANEVELTGVMSSAIGVNF